MPRLEKTQLAGVRERWQDAVHRAGIEGLRDRRIERAENLEARLKRGERRAHIVRERCEKSAHLARVFLRQLRDAIVHRHGFERLDEERGAGRRLVVHDPRHAVLRVRHHREYEPARADRDDLVLQDAVRRERAHAPLELTTDVVAHPFRFAADPRKLGSRVVAHGAACIERAIEPAREVRQRVERARVGRERGQVVASRERRARLRRRAEQSREREEIFAVEDAAGDRGLRNDGTRIGEMRDAKRIVLAGEAQRFVDFAPQHLERFARADREETTNTIPAAWRSGATRHQVEDLRELKCVENV
jgi:hypothetical protein